jgi:hypothetical protein
VPAVQAAICLHCVRHRWHLLPVRVPPCSRHRQQQQQQQRQPSQCCSLCAPHAPHPQVTANVRAASDNECNAVDSRPAAATRTLRHPAAAAAAGAGGAAGLETKQEASRRPWQR